jgi:hypothetical protein
MPNYACLMMKFAFMNKYYRQREVQNYQPMDITAVLNDPYFRWPDIKRCSFQCGSFPVLHEESWDVHAHKYVMTEEYCLHSQKCMIPKRR